MPTEKDTEFVQFLLDSTQKGNLQWQPSAEENQFTTTLQQRFSAFVTKESDDLFRLVLNDPAGQELIFVRNSSISQVADLYEFVRRQALNVDTVLDQIMRDKNLVIITARYGSRDHRFDVSQLLNNAIVDDKLHVFIGNQLAGDPTPNVPKDLILEYRFHGQSFQRIVKEGETLDLP